MEERKHIVILAAGDFPSHPVALQTLHEADFIVCCDSAYGGWSVTSGQWSASKSFVVIGDGDSLSGKDKQQLGERWIHVAEQDYNDLHKAMHWATSHFSIHTSHFSILGATGKREDHTLGNISYLVTFAEEYPGIDLEMLTDYGRFHAMTGSRIFPSFSRQQVSLFTMDPDLPICADGLRWPLDAFHARRWWQASLNEALSTEFSLRTEGHLVVFQTYEPKA